MWLYFGDCLFNSKNKAAKIWKIFCCFDIHASFEGSQLGIATNYKYLFSIHFQTVHVRDMQSLVATDTFRIHPLLFLNSDYANHKSRPIPTEKCWVYLESQISKSSIRNPETRDSQIRKHFQEFSNLLKGGLYLPNISYIFIYDGFKNDVSFLKEREAFFLSKKAIIKLVL